MINKELCSGRMRIGGASHRDSAALIFQSVVGFVFNRGFGSFLLHILSKTAALNHKTVNHSVENRVVIKTFLSIIQKVLCADWCIFFV